jgi:hypothetical protein
MATVVQPHVRKYRGHKVRVKGFVRTYRAHRVRVEAYRRGKGKETFSR